MPLTQPTDFDGANEPRQPGSAKCIKSGTGKDAALIDCGCMWLDNLGDDLLQRSEV